MAGVPNPLAAAVTRELPKYGSLDPRAVLAVAAQEGLGGAIGDNGTSFGPFQLHQGGAYPSFAPQTAGQAQTWASSPAGIDYALSRMAAVAGGLHGQQAVQSIVSRFERPANVAGEVAAAERAYGGVTAPTVRAGITQASGGGRGTGTVAQAAAPTQDFRPQLASELAAAAGSSTNDLNGFYQTLGQALRARAAGPAQTAAQTPGPVPHPGAAHVAPPLSLGGLVAGNTHGENAGFLQDLANLAKYEGHPVDINSGYRSLAEQQQLYANRASNPNPVAAPGHSLHEQGLAADGTVGGVPLGKLPAAVLRRFGLATVPGDPVHVQVAR